MAVARIMTCMQTDASRALHLDLCHASVASAGLLAAACIIYLACSGDVSEVLAIWFIDISRTVWIFVAVGASSRWESRRYPYYAWFSLGFLYFVHVLIDVAQLPNYWYLLPLLVMLPVVSTEMGCRWWCRTTKPEQLVMRIHRIDEVDGTATAVSFEAVSTFTHGAQVTLNLCQAVFQPALSGASLKAFNLVVLRPSLLAIGPLWLMYGLCWLVGAGGRTIVRPMQVIGGWCAVAIWLIFPLFAAPPTFVVWVHESILLPFTGVYAAFVMDKLWPPPDATPATRMLRFAIVGVYALLCCVMGTGLVIALPPAETGGVVPSWFTPMILFGFLPTVSSVVVMSSVKWCCYPKSHSIVAFSVLQRRKNSEGAAGTGTGTGTGEVGLGGGTRSRSTGGGALL